MQTFKLKRIVMKTPKLVSTIVLLATVLPLSSFAAEPMLSDDLETPDALIREVHSDDAGETLIQLDKNLEVEQVTQDPLIGATEPYSRESINAEPADAASAKNDAEKTSATLVQEDASRKNTVQEKTKIKEKKKKEKWSSIFSRETEAQRTNQETPDPLLDDL
jgi:hypothetical protein